MEIMGKVLRSARVCLDIPAAIMAEAANIGLRTLGRLEAGDSRISVSAYNEIRRKLEEEGIRFLPATPDHGPGFVMPLPGFVGPLARKAIEARKAAETPSVD